MASVGDVSAEKNPGVFMPPVPESGDGNVQFTSVPLEKKKTPRRILHFSDGVLEEYSTDEEEEDPKPLQPPVDPKTLKWMPWMFYYVSTAAYKAWRAADFCGEKLAWFFGITTPKYQSAIDEYYRRKEEEEREKAEQQKREEAARGLSAVDFKIVEDQQFVGEKLEKY